MKTFTDEYIKLNKDLHESCDSYGANAGKWMDAIIPIIQQYGIKTVLDYGCGKGVLKTLLKDHVERIEGYDPAIDEFKHKPDGAFDLVLCLDVMEHIEPEFTDNVLVDLLSSTNRLMFCNIATSLAAKTLSDGRNTHINIHTENWWLHKMLKYWDCISAARIFNAGSSYRSINYLGVKYGLSV